MSFANKVFNKAISLACIVDRQEQFKPLIAQYQAIHPSHINTTFFEALRAELHFTEMHQFEGFFALLLAIFNDIPHWIYLTAYHPSQIADAINQFIKGDIKSVTGERAKTDREFVSIAVYTTYQPQVGLQKEKWNENLENIAWLIRHMAEKYMAGKGEYNSYKHGLRVMRGESSPKIVRQSQEGNRAGSYVTISRSEDALGYLEFEEGVSQTIQDPRTNQMTNVFTPKNKKEEKENDQPKEQDGKVLNEVDAKKVSEISKYFNPKESMYHMTVMNRLLATMKKTRLAFYTDKGDPGQLATYFALDPDEFLALREKCFAVRSSI